jgi:cytochrome c oxidase assembly protein subunit 15
MWSLGYAARLPWIMAPAWSILVVMLVLLVVGGAIGGWACAGRSSLAGAMTGVAVSVVNLLVLGGLVSGEQPQSVRPSALLWLPGSLIAGGALGALGGWLGRGLSAGARRRCYADARGLLPVVAAAATLVLLLIGGLVTSSESGLAVVDWPNSFGYSMFLYPLSRMTGGIYFEHAHRLFGALVGLVTLVLMVQTLRRDARRGVRRLAVAAFVLVVAQGVLGGLRVTGRFTAATDAAVMRPSSELAAVHGVVAQAFFALLLVLAVVSSRSWRREGAGKRGGSARQSVDVWLGVLVVVLLVVQAGLGAVVRHLGRWLLGHIVFAVPVILASLVFGLRLWGLHESEPRLRRPGAALTVLVGLQVLLGLAALVVTGALRGGLTEPGSYGARSPGIGEVLVATAHQVNGALLLIPAVIGVLWAWRLIGAGEGR